MRFKYLEWKDVISEGEFVCSHCKINLCSVIEITFCINHELEDGKYYLYTYGKGSLRRLKPEKYGSIESAKNAAYRIYSNEMARIKKSVEYLMVT